MYAKRYKLNKISLTQKQQVLLETVEHIHNRRFHGVSFPAIVSRLMVRANREVNQARIAITLAELIDQKLVTKDTSRGRDEWGKEKEETVYFPANSVFIK